MTYSFRSLYHGHCVFSKRFIPQIQTCLDRAQLPSSHFVIKEKVLWLAEAQEGLVLWPCLHNQESRQGIMQWEKHEHIIEKIKKKRKSIFQKHKTLQDLDGVLSGEDKTKYYFSKWGKRSRSQSSCSLLFTAASLTGILLGHSPWQHDAKVLSGVSSSVKCYLPFCMGNSVHCSRVVLLILNREMQQWPSILTLASSQQCGSRFSLFAFVYITRNCTSLAHPWPFFVGSLAAGLWNNGFTNHNLRNNNVCCIFDEQSDKRYLRKMLSIDKDLLIQKIQCD